MSKKTDAARAFFGAAESGDEQALRDACSDALIASQNGGPEMGLAELSTFAMAVKRVIPDFRYENIVCQDTGDGFVEEHDIRGTLPGGDQLATRVCVVAEVEEGRITELREYVDMAAAAGLIRALGG